MRPQRSLALSLVAMTAEFVMWLSLFAALRNIERRIDRMEIPACSSPK